MIKVYDYDAADGSWADVIGQRRWAYDKLGIPCRIAVDGLYAERRLAESDYDILDENQDDTE